MSTTRWIIEAPCELEAGVLHDRPGTNNRPCGYLAHIYCDKCGWVQGPHPCTKRIVVDPANLPPERLERAVDMLVAEWEVDSADEYNRGAARMLATSLVTAFLSDPEPGDQT